MPAIPAAQSIASLSNKMQKTWSTPVTEEGLQPVPCAVCGGANFRPSLSCEGFSYVKCAVCGLVQMNPQPLAADVGRRYRDLHGSDYCSYELRNEANFLELQKLALKDAGFDRIEHELMNRDTKPSVLDLGCAAGAMLSYLKERGWQPVGVEISPAAGYARKERNLDVRQSIFEECHFPDESFDLALASHFIEHLNNPATCAKEAWRVLRRGGYFLITTPNIVGFQARLFGSRWRSAIFDHLYLFSKHTVSAMLVNSGFEIEDIYTWGGLAAGTVPLPLKRFADNTAKILGIGDVMLIKARKK